MSLACALLVAVAAANVPWHADDLSVGWQYRATYDRSAIEPDEVRWVDVGLGTFHEPPAPAARVVRPQVEPRVIDEGADDNPLPQPFSIAPRDRIVEQPDVRPKFVGGLASYYIDIEYPEKARLDGIEGRLVLRFVVTQDGSVEQIEVVKKLHPLCDSAAVSALRKAHFVPGMINGETVAVRMNLPVRFVLVDAVPDSLSGPPN